MYRNSSHLLQVILFIFSLQSIHICGYGATATLDYSKKYQTIEGFGGGLMFHIYPYNHPKKDEIYDSIFNKAGINIIRVGNWYNPQDGNEVIEVPMMNEIQQRWPAVKTMLTSWSPPPYLKSNNSTFGAFVIGENMLDSGTLKKNSDSAYMYKEYGDYWLQSVQYFKSRGMKIDWVSIQNEPDFPAQHEGCVMEAWETPSLASYGKALNAVFNKFKTGLDAPMPLIGPDVAGIYLDRMSRFLTSTETDRNQLVAYCHHYYDHPDQTWIRKAGEDGADKPIYQTEFLINDGEPDWTGLARTWFDHALYIHNSLTVEGVSMYCLFTLAYKPASTHCFFSMDTTGGEWYQTRPTYYMFKHFSKSIHRGWRRIEAKSDDTTLLVSAYCDANNDSTAIVLINPSDIPRNVFLSFPGKTGEVHLTSDSCKYAYRGKIDNSGAVDLMGKSMATIDIRTDFTGAVFPAKQHPAATARIDRVTAVRPGILAVRFSAPQGPYTLSVFNIRGTLMTSCKLPRNRMGGEITRLLKKNLPCGSYSVVLRSGTVVATGNFIIAY